MNYKRFDLTVLEDRVYEVLDENGEEIDGVAMALLQENERSLYISIDIIFDFCEHYGCSIDYLVGRTDKYWM